jgi:hypothetical protein
MIALLPCPDRLKKSGTAKRRQSHSRKPAIPRVVTLKKKSHKNLRTLARPHVLSRRSGRLRIWVDECAAPAVHTGDRVSEKNTTVNEEGMGFELIEELFSHQRDAELTARPEIRSQGSGILAATEELHCCMFEKILLKKRRFYECVVQR